MNGSGTRTTGCVAHPAAGVLRYHYFNKALIDDLVDVDKLEGLVYTSTGDGNMRLVAGEASCLARDRTRPG